MTRTIAGTQGDGSPIQRMGYGNDRIRVQCEFRNRPVTMIIAGKRYRFDSEYEGMWGCYCELRKTQKLILDWEHEQIRFDFFPFGYRNKPFEYTPDFRITRLDGTQYFEETKGYTETKDLSRFLRAAKHYDAKFELIMQKTPRSGKGSEIVAKAQTAWYISRVVNGTDIIRQCGKQLLLSFCEIVE